MLLHVLLCLVIATVQVNAGGGSEWGYVKGTIEPSHWKDIPNTMCDGSMQSPVDVQVGMTEYDSRLQDVSFLHVTSNPTVDRMDIKLLNDGHKLILSLLNSEDSVSMYFGDDQSRFYRMVHIHWHWGAMSSRGSEHTVNGKSYPIEGHVVTYDSKVYNSAGEAMKSPGGLAVIGFFYQVTTSKEGTALLNNITSQIKSTPLKPSEFTTLKSFQLLQLLPKKTKDYYRYRGSLTTPSCTENVLWTVLKEPLPITEEQLDIFRSLQYSGNLGAMVDNFRPVQPLNPSGRTDAIKRVITRSFKNAAISISCGSSLYYFLSVAIASIWFAH